MVDDDDTVELTVTIPRWQAGKFKRLAEFNGHTEAQLLATAIDLAWDAYTVDEGNPGRAYLGRVYSGDKGVQVIRMPVRPTERDWTTYGATARELYAEYCDEVELNDERPQPWESLDILWQEEWIWRVKRRTVR